MTENKTKAIIENVEIQNDIELIEDTNSKRNKNDKIEMESVDEAQEQK